MFAGVGSYFQLQNWPTPVVFQPQVMSFPLLAPDGVIAYSFASDPVTGMSRYGDGSIAFHQSESLALLINANFVKLPLAVALAIEPGANQRAGNVSLVAGTVTVANSTVTADTLISLTRKTAGGTIGNLTYTLNPGVGFTINSDNALDTSAITYLLIELS